MQSDLLEPARAELRALIRPHSLGLQAELDIRAHPHPRKDRIVLKHHSALGRRAAYDFPGRVDLSRREGIEPPESAQQRRLSVAGAPDDADELPRGDIQRDATKRFHPAPGNVLEHAPCVVDLDGTIAGIHPVAPVSAQRVASARTRAMTQSMTSASTPR